MTRFMFSSASLGLLLIGLTGTTQAQQPATPFSRMSPLTTFEKQQTRSPITMRPVQAAKDYRWKGALIGGFAGVLVGGIAGAVICSQDDTDGNDCPLTIIGVAALTGAPLAILGGIIGANIKKPPSTE